MGVMFILFWNVLLSAASLAFCQTAPTATWPYPNGKPSDTAAAPSVQVSAVQTLGRQDSVNIAPHGLALRDLGFSGVIGGQSIWTYGDCLYQDNSTGVINYMSPGCAAFGNVSHPNQVWDTLNDQDMTERLIYPNASELAADPRALDWAFGSTQMIEPVPGSGKGINFYLVNNRTGFETPTYNNNNMILGAGISAVTVPPNGSGQVTTRRAPWTWSPTDPGYGCQFALVNNDGYVYAYGHGLSSTVSEQLTYVARAQAVRATDGEDLWEYWNGAGWQETTTDDTAAGLFPSGSTAQGSIFWSNYYKCYMIVTVSRSVTQQVRVRTSNNPVTGWSKDTVVYTHPAPNPKPSNPLHGTIYAAVGHPEYDDTGKTLYITFTVNPNDIEGVVVTWV